LIATVIVAYGGWTSMREEGTTFEAARDQLQSRYAQQPVPERRPLSEPRSIPGPESAPEPEPFEEDEPPSRPPPPV
jgi:hypothetical protein